MKAGLQPSRRSWLRALVKPGVSILLIVLAILFLDRPLAEFCRSFSPAVHTVFRYVSLLASFPVALGMSLILVALYFIRVYSSRKPRAIQARYLFIAFSTMTAWALAYLFKLLFGRCRPDMLFRYALYGFTWFKTGYDFNSFPSGHAAIAFGFWMAVAQLKPRLKPVFLIVAALLAASRVIITAHFLSDVLFGALLAATVTLVISRLFEKQGCRIRK